MTDKEMFEISFQRPNNYFELTYIEQFEIDKRLGIENWVRRDLTQAEKRRFWWHYNTEKSA